MRFRRSTPYEGGISGYICYEVRENGQVYALKTPCSAASENPEYVMRGNYLYRTRHHPVGFGATPDYEIRDAKLYRSGDHHWGPKTLPDYDVVP